VREKEEKITDREEKKEVKIMIDDRACESLTGEKLNK